MSKNRRFLEVGAAGPFFTQRCFTAEKKATVMSDIHLLLAQKPAGFFHTKINQNIKDIFVMNYSLRMNREKKKHVASNHCTPAGHPSLQSINLLTVELEQSNWPPCSDLCVA